MKEDDSEFYLKAQQEVDSGTKEPALWAKAIAIEAGDQEKASHRYVVLRAEQLTVSSQETINDEDAGSEVGETPEQAKKEKVRFTSQIEPTMGVTVDPENSLAYKVPLWERLFFSVINVFFVGCAVILLFVIFSGLGQEIPKPSQRLIGWIIMSLTLAAIVASSLFFLWTIWTSRYKRGITGSFIFAFSVFWLIFSAWLTQGELTAREHFIYAGLLAFNFLISANEYKKRDVSTLMAVLYIFGLLFSFQFITAGYQNRLPPPGPAIYDCSEEVKGCAFRNWLIRQERD